MDDGEEQQQQQQQQERNTDEVDDDDSLGSLSDIKDLGSFLMWGKDIEEETSLDYSWEDSSDQEDQEEGVEDVGTNDDSSNISFNNSNGAQSILPLRRSARIRLQANRELGSFVSENGARRFSWRLRKSSS